MIDPISFHEGRVSLFPGDCLQVMGQLAENSIDSCVVDPPYHLQSIVDRFAKTGRTESTSTKSGPHQRTATGFMGKQWDGGDIAFQPDTWAKVLRVLKPGAYIVAFSSSRTFGRMSVALEDAGFITHPMIGWIFAQGFPKATRIRAEGYDGFRYGGQALKPALEPIYVGQKPFSEANGTANILRWGTGAINIDGCRVGTSKRVPGSLSKTANNVYGSGLGGHAQDGTESGHDPNIGRWPANLVLSDDAEVIEAFPNLKGAGPTRPGKVLDTPTSKAEGWGNIGQGPNGARFGDAGSAARFFFQAKADAEDRAGSRHPTVKPLDLMRYLVRLVTPPRGLVLDPFAGSDTTGHAALIEGMRVTLIEREAEYQADIARRMDLVFAGQDERARKLAKAEPHESMPFLEASHDPPTQTSPRQLSRCWPLHCESLHRHEPQGFAMSALYGFDRLAEDIADVSRSEVRARERCVYGTASPIEHLYLIALLSWGDTLRAQPFDYVYWPNSEWSADLDTETMIIRSQKVLIENWPVDFVLSLRGDKASAHVVIECDGHEFHERTKDQAARDRSRDRQLQDKGFAILRYTGAEIWRDPMRCAKETYDFIYKQAYTTWNHD